MSTLKKLAFLNAVGCAAVAGGGCAAVICLALAALVWAVALFGEGDLAIPGLDAMPRYLQPLYADPRVITTVALVGSAFVLVAGIGLLLRRRWGRRLAIVVCGVGIVWVIVALPIGWHVQDRAVDQPGVAPAWWTVGITKVINMVVAAAVLVLLVAVLGVLARPEIKAQFNGRRKGQRLDRTGSSA
jgi:hypothetical protein